MYLNFPEIYLPYELFKTNKLGQLFRQIRTSASNDGLGFLKYICFIVKIDDCPTKIYQALWMKRSFEIWFGQKSSNPRGQPWKPGDRSMCNFPPSSWRGSVIQWWPYFCLCLGSNPRMTFSNYREGKNEGEIQMFMAVSYCLKI